MIPKLITLSNGKHIHLGSYNRIEQATFAYKIAAEKYFGEFAHVNS